MVEASRAEKALCGEIQEATQWSGESAGAKEAPAPKWLQSTSLCVPHASMLELHN